MGFRSASLLLRRAMAGVALASLFALSACGGDDDPPSGPGGGVAGTYALVSIDADPVPVVESETYDDGMGGTYTETTTINNGSLAVASGGSYTLTANGSYQFDTNAPEAFAIVEGGSWSALSSGQFRFISSSLRVNGTDAFESPDTTTATLSGKTLTSVEVEEVSPGVNETTTAVFRKP